MASSEDLVISAVLMTGDGTPLVQEGVSADLFEVRKNEWAWLAQQIERSREVPSRVAFTQQFPSFTVYDVRDTRIFIDQLKHDSARARLTDLIDNTIGVMEQGHIDGALTSLSAELLSIQATMTTADPHYDLTADWASTYADVEQRVARVNTLGTAGVPTGFGSLDLATGGLQPGWFCIVAGRLGAGKTWTMVRMAAEAAMEGYKVLYFSLEQSRHQIALRAQSIYAHEAGAKGVRVTDLMRGINVNLSVYKDFLEHTLPTIVKGDLWINDTTRGRVGPMQIASAIEAHQPDIVFIDYLTLMEMQGDGDWNSVSRLSADLKRVAERYEVPMVAGSQLNRNAVGQDRPDPGQLSRSDSVGQDADLVLAVTKDKVTPEVVKLDLIKFRHGADGTTFYCRFRPGQGEYEEISGDKAETLRDLARDAN